MLMPSFCYCLSSLRQIQRIVKRVGLNRKPLHESSLLDIEQAILVSSIIIQYTRHQLLGVCCIYREHYDINDASVVMFFSQ